MKIDFINTLKTILCETVGKLAAMRCNTTDDDPDWTRLERMRNKTMELLHEANEFLKRN